MISHMLKLSKITHHHQWSLLPWSFWILITSAYDTQSQETVAMEFTGGQAQEPERVDLFKDTACAWRSHFSVWQFSPGKISSF